MPGLKALEQHLLRAEILDQPRIERASSEAQKNGLSLAEAITQLGYATPEAVYKSLADFCEMRFVLASKVQAPPELVAKIPARFATHYGFVPIEERNGTLVIALADPLNTHLLDDIRLVLKRRIEAVVTTPEEIHKATKELYGVGADTMERILQSTAAEGPVVNLESMAVSSDLGDDSIDASIIKFVNELILEAIQSETTDIHIEPFEDQLRVRYRIDGILHQAPTPPSIRGFQSAIVSRIKIMANLNIAEKRLPQDGKILATFGDKQYDLRVSVLPTPHGETVNLRILSRSSMFLTMDQLGFLPEDMKLFNSFISKPHGIILVTGPTGSGKTTTLYAALSKLNKLDRKIITIEDPIEYQLKGITQMQVQPRIGFDFALGLRSMRSRLTGHLVLSTLHTNDAAGAVTRLIDMGVEPFLISSTMIASVAQRLVRRICKYCAEPHHPDELLLQEEFGLSLEQVRGQQFMRGRGCDACRHTGYKGRVAVYEMLPFTNEIKYLTVQRATALDIKQKALDQGMRTLRNSGWRRVCAGETTLEEVLRVTADVESIAAPAEMRDAPVSV
ncbi:MAG: Flp pilus assembly complex ATPase component TadA [Candidatus Hydrogenedentes bacterium]|nr:Flp pilus assembly complex ATPase component TadA [Candidatus Hydrogenedentota bacterium]